MPSNMQTENSTRQNAGGPHRLESGMARMVIRAAQSWVTRQGLKLAAATSAMVFAYLHGRYDLHDDTALQIAAGAGAVVTGILEISLSFLNMKLAPKAEPVEEQTPTNTNT